MARIKIRRIVGDLNTERIKRVLTRVRKPSREALNYSVRLNKDYSLVKFSRIGQEVFFGYYDKRQLDEKGERLLACSVTSAVAGKKEPDALMEVGFFDTNSTDFVSLAKTHAYNWQQGCMLRWLPGSDDNLVMFNDYKDDRFVSVIVDSTTGREVGVYPYPTYDVAPSSTLIASCDFSRLHRRRLGYGYWQRCAACTSEVAGDGAVIMIQLYNIGQPFAHRSICLAEIQNALALSQPIYVPYVNHLSFAPDSKSLLFFFFWKDSFANKMAVLYYDFQKDKLAVLTRNYMSHFCWKNNKTLVAWGSNDKGEMAYYCYNLESFAQSIYWHDTANTDGHCSISEDGMMLTDTYPDHAGFQHLMTRSSQGTVTRILSIYSPVRFSFDLRCDLHPRFTAQSDCYTFDSAMGGSRSTYLVSHSAK